MRYCTRYNTLNALISLNHQRKCVHLSRRDLQYDSYPNNVGKIEGSACVFCAEGFKTTNVLKTVAKSKKETASSTPRVAKSLKTAAKVERACAVFTPRIEIPLMQFSVNMHNWNIADARAADRQLDDDCNL